MQTYEQTIKQVITNLQDELNTDLLGVLLVGSYAYGTPGPQSDIDLFIIIRPLWRQRRTFFVAGVEVELFLNPVQQIRAEFRDTDAPATIAMFAQGRILFDPEGVVSQLVQEAQQIWQQSCPALVPASYNYFYQRYNCVDLLKDAQDLLDTDTEAALFVIFAALQAALEAHYCIQRLWPVKPKYQLSDLAQHAPTLIPYVRPILASHLPIPERYMALEALIDHVLEPVGGRLHAWNSSLERLYEASE